jgi:hypothetical protein
MRKFDRPKLWKPNELEVVRTNAIAGLKNHSPESPEYKKIIRHVEDLTKLIDAQRREKLNVNTVLVVLGNAGIAGLVLWFERDNVVKTKLHSFMHKAKN